MIIDMYRKGAWAFRSVHSDLDLTCWSRHRYVVLLLGEDLGSYCTSTLVLLVKQQLYRPSHVGYVKLYATGSLRTSSIETSSA
jgi:hypothetical protein